MGQARSPHRVAEVPWLPSRHGDSHDPANLAAAAANTVKWMESGEGKYSPTDSFSAGTLGFVRLGTGTSKAHSVDWVSHVPAPQNSTRECQVSRRVHKMVHHGRIVVVRVLLWTPE